MTSRAHLDRRNFLRAAVGTAATVGAGSAFTVHTTVAAAGRHIPNSKISIQLYTVRNAMDADPEATLRALAEGGYRNVEPFSLHGKTPVQFRAILDRYGLTAVSSHVGYADVQGAALWRTIETANILGQKYFVVPGGVPHTVEGFQEAADIFNRAGAAGRHSGLTFGYHNHTSEFEKVDGKVLYDVLLSRSDPHLVKMQLDVGWAVAAGADPVALFEANKNRFRLLHVKDVNAEHEPIDLGTPGGIVDWDHALSGAVRHGVKEYVIENDNPNDPRTSDRSARMREWLVNFTF